MSGVIYQIDQDGSVQELRDQAYGAELDLQRLIENHPKLLGGEQIDSSDPREFLLVTREMGLASEPDGGDRWSVDHLFLDQEGVPTLVEVKRSQNSEIRRSVVGQILDYAAHAAVYCPVNRMRERFVRDCEKKGRDPDEVLSKFLGDDVDAEAFWESVNRNLENGRLRLLIVADEIHSELRRVVEFLNQQMDPCEVLAIEVKQYVATGESGSGWPKSLVPRVLGQTARTQDKKKAGASRKRWTEELFIQALENRDNPRYLKAAKQILNWAKSRSATIDWGTGSVNGSFSPKFLINGVKVGPINVYPTGVEVRLGPLRRTPPFDQEDETRRLIDRINSLAGMVASDETGSSCYASSDNYLSDDAVQYLCDFLDWVLDQATMATDPARRTPE